MTLLRDYQQRAVNAVFEQWKDVRSTLVVQPTGTGKTTVFTDVIRRCQPERAMIVAHREELIFQAQKRMESQGGLACEIEMGDQSASEVFRSPVVAATVQTLISGSGDSRRMHRFSPHDFGLLVIDEGHHSTAASYRKIIEHFSQNPDLKILGVTATPDRADEEALGQIFETVADVYEILDAIHDGWLVPVDQQMVNIEDLDFSSVRTTAGDLNASELAAVMEGEKILQGVCGATLELVGKRQTIVFTASVRHAEMACDIFNRHQHDMADWISGKTPKEKRREIMAHFHDGDLQILCNVGCLTEGVDVPKAEIVVMGRPTKSRSLYAQMAGRILRPLPGLVDGKSTPEERRAAISNSVKPSALIIDFSGNAGRHKLITSADILGGNVSEEAIELAVRKARESGQPVRMADELDEAEHELELQRARQEERKRLLQARQAHLMAKVRYQSQRIDPFRAYGLLPQRERGWDLGKELSLKQRAVLLKMGVDPDGLPYGPARQLLNEQFRRWTNKLCTLKQAACLRKFGYDTKDMAMSEASRLLDQLAKNGWRKVA